jgi:hypothetical protein
LGRSSLLGSGPGPVPTPVLAPTSGACTSVEFVVPVRGSGSGAGPGQPLRGPSYDGVEALSVEDG